MANHVEHISLIMTGENFCSYDVTGPFSFIQERIWISFPFSFQCCIDAVSFAQFAYESKPHISESNSLPLSTFKLLTGRK